MKNSKLKKYPKYKPSGIEWIGDASTSSAKGIPEHWEVKKLKFVAKINSTLKHYNFNKDSEEEVIFLPMEKVSEDGKIIQDIRKKISEVSSGFTYFEKYDVIIAKITPCFENGKAALLTNLETNFGFGSTEFYTIKATDQINRRFLFYIVKSDYFMSLGETFMTGSAGQKRVPADFVREFFTTVPPMDEQTAIANYLDDKTAKIDTLIEKKKRLIELYKEERTAIINQAVTRGINLSVKLKPSGVEWLGQIPEHWEVKKLKYVAKLKSGESITSDNIREADDFPVYGGNGLRGYTSSYTHEGNFVLIGRQGALCGNINYAKGKFFASEHAVVVSRLNNEDLLWFGELLRSMNLNQYSISAAQPGLSVERIQNLQIPYPNKDEQIAISKHIETETKRIEGTISKIEKEIELLAEYRTALISEVVTGKIKVC